MSTLALAGRLALPARLSPCNLITPDSGLRQYLLVFFSSSILILDQEGIRRAGLGTQEHRQETIE